MRICLASRPTEFVAVQVNTFTIFLFKCLARIDSLLPTTLSVLVFDAHVIVGVGTPVEIHS